MATFRLPVSGPFHLEATVRLLQRRPSNPVDRWEDGRYLRLLPGSWGDAVVAVENAGTIAAPDLRVTLAHAAVGPADRRQIARTLEGMLGLDRDPSAFERCAARDPRLRPLVRALRGMRPPSFPSLFETLLNVVPFQQVSVDAGAAIVGRLVERLGRRVETGGQVFFAFPAPEAVADAPMDALRQAGLSRAKASALKELAERVLAGELRQDAIERLPTSEALRRLTALRGIGPWSAGLILLRGLGRMDSFPANDVGVLRGLTAVLQLADRGPETLGALAAAYGEQKGYLYFYSLGAQLLARGLIHPAR